MSYFKNRVKKILLIFLLSIFFISFLLIVTSSQELDEKREKQLRIFQLSRLLEKENGFPQQKAYFNNALAYFDNEHFSFAIRELEKIEYSHLTITLYLKSQLLQGKCYEIIDRWESALYLYENLLNTVPLMQDYIIYFLGQVYLNINDLDRAIESFQQVLEEYPESVLVPLCRYQIALIYLEQNQIEQFLKECRSAIEISLEDHFKAQVLAKISAVLWEEGFLVDSIGYLKEIIENRYDRERITRYEDLYVNRFQIIRQSDGMDIKPEFILFCAEILFNYRQYRVAETLYGEAITHYPEQVDLAQVYYNRARAIYYQGDYERAIEQCIYILDTFYTEEIIIRTIYLYAGALLSIGNRNEAVIKYQEIIASYPESYFAPSSYLRLSEIEFLRDNKEEGIYRLNQLIYEYPQSTQTREACWKLARYYTNHHEIREALQYYRIIHERFPQSSQGDDALYWMGKLLYQQDREESSHWFSLLLNQFPDSYFAFRIPFEFKESYHTIESIISQSRKIDIEEFKKGYFPEDRMAQWSTHRAEILQAIGLYQEAALETRVAVRWEPGNAYLMYLLTETYSKAGQYYYSIGWAQTLLNYFLDNNQIRQMPFKIWEYCFPRYYLVLVQERAHHYGLDPYLVWSTIREESHFNRFGESRAGARGLMQIILSTGEWIAQKVNYEEFKYDSLFAPEVNIDFGCWYLQYLQKKFNQNYYLIISGYNAGPGITDRWIERIDMSDIDYFVENIPYQETTEHIKKVMRSYMLYQIVYK